MRLPCSCIPRLSIKSLPPAAAGTPNAKPAYAVLCTPNKTYQIRQVQTSNSVFVTQPVLAAHGNDVPTPTTCAIASCAHTLELHPADIAAAASHLEDALPVYDIVDGEVDARANGVGKAGVFTHVPLSLEQCQRAWDDIMAFELSGSSYRPSAASLAQVWASIHAAALAEGIQLDSQFMANDVAKMVEEEGYPTPLALAVFRHLAPAGQDVNEWSCLDKTKTVSFVGKTLLQARRGVASDYSTDAFLQTWKDSLPEAWRVDAELSAIGDVYELPSSATIRIKSAPTAANGAPVASKTAAKGKWHERFAKTRKK